MDISHYWDTVPNYSANEIAYLVIGIDPEIVNTKSLASVESLKKKMHVSFLDACAHLRFCVETSRDWGETSAYFWANDDADSMIFFASTDMFLLADQVRSARDSATYEATRERFLDWLDRAIDDFENQRFSREEIRYWLGEQQIPSMYPFKQARTKTKEERIAEIKELLAKNGGNKSATARELGISRTRIDQLLATERDQGARGYQLLAQDPFNLSSPPKKMK